MKISQMMKRMEKLRFKNCLKFKSIIKNIMKMIKNKKKKNSLNHQHLEAITLIYWTVKSRTNSRNLLQILIIKVKPSKMIKIIMKIKK
jgi:hypothetical protein